MAVLYSPLSNLSLFTSQLRPPSTSMTALSTVSFCVICTTPNNNIINYNLNIVLSIVNTLVQIHLHECVTSLLVKLFFASCRRLLIVVLMINHRSTELPFYALVYIDWHSFAKGAYVRTYSSHWVIYLTAILSNNTIFFTASKWSSVCI